MKLCGTLNGLCRKNPHKCGERHLFFKRKCDLLKSFFNDGGSGGDGNDNVPARTYPTGTVAALKRKLHIDLSLHGSRIREIKVVNIKLTSTDIYNFAYFAARSMLPSLEDIVVQKVKGTHSVGVTSLEPVLVIYGIVDFQHIPVAPPPSDDECDIPIESVTRPPQTEVALLPQLCQGNFLRLSRSNARLTTDHSPS